MKKIIILVAWIGGLLHGFAQTVKVIDKNRQEPIPGCIIYSKHPLVSIVTNSKGQADISAFKDADSIFFRFIGFREAAFNYQKLEALKFLVEMEEDNISLNEVVISSNRWEEKEIEVPARVEKITRRKIAFQNPQTTADMLETSGYVYIQKSQQAGGSPNLRGFATNRVMIVVDGVRMNNAIFRSGNLQNVISVDANALESAEVLFGPGAVMYGSDAIGGVMDFHTLQPKLADTTSKLLFAGNSFARYSSVNKEKTGHLDFSIGLKKWAFTSSFTYADYEDLRAGTIGNSYFLRPTYVETINGKDSMLVNKDPSMQIGSEFGQVNLMQKIRFKPNRFWDIDYAFHYSASSNAGRYDRLVLDANKDSILDNAEWYYGPQIWQMSRLGVTHTKSTFLYDQLRIVAAHQYYEESRHDRKFNSNQLRHQSETVDAISVNLDLDRKVNEKMSLFYGAEGVYNYVGSAAIRTNRLINVATPTTTRYPNGSTWQAYGAYANFKYRVNKKFIVTAGARYSQYSIKADFDTTMFPFPFVHAENSNGALNGSLGFVFTPNATWQLYLNGSTGFRAPNIDDLGKVFDSQPGNVVVPNASLKPEYAYNAELGTAKTFGSILKVDFAAYYTWLNNALARRPFLYGGQDSLMYEGQLSQVLAVQNIASAYVYGLQAGVEISFGKGVSLKSAINYQKGEEQSEDNLVYYPKPHVAPLFGSTHLIYERKKLKLDLYVLYNGKMDFSDLPLVDRIDNASYAKDEKGLPYTPGWYALNFKAAWFISQNFVLSGGIENITDQLYRPFSSGISAPGRNFYISVRCKI